jgi:hypothetical protein
LMQVRDCCTVIEIEVLLDRCCFCEQQGRFVTVCVWDRWTFQQEPTRGHMIVFLSRLLASREPTRYKIGRRWLEFFDWRHSINSQQR